MRIIPCEKYRIDTPLSKEEAVSILRLKTTKERYRFGHINPGKLFRGEVNGSCFTISRIIQGRNSFLPVVKGSISERDKGAEVVMELTIDTSVSTVYICYLCFSVIFFLLSLYATILNRSFDFGIIMSLLLGCFGFGLAKLSFNYEASKIKKVIHDLLLADHLS